MIEEEENLERIGVWVNENSFAVNLEGMRASLAWIGNDTVGNFQAVDVGLIFLKAAEGAAKYIGNETENSDEQEKRG